MEVFVTKASTDKDRFSPQTSSGTTRRRRLPVLPAPVPEDYPPALPRWNPSGGRGRFTSNNLFRKKKKKPFFGPISPPLTPRVSPFRNRPVGPERRPGCKRENYGVWGPSGLWCPAEVQVQRGKRNLYCRSLCRALVVESLHLVTLDLPALCIDPSTPTPTSRRTPRLHPTRGEVLTPTLFLSVLSVRILTEKVQWTEEPSPDLLRRHLH